MGNIFTEKISFGYSLLCLTIRLCIVVQNQINSVDMQLFIEAVW